MEFAVNYSKKLRADLEAGRVTIDRFKCPSWPGLIDEAQSVLPCYVHLPLEVGSGTGSVLNTETHDWVDWDFIDAVLAQSGTPMINLHLAPKAAEHPDLESDEINPAAIDALVERTLRDVAVVTARYGKERVLAENLPYQPDIVMSCIHPEYARGVIEAADIRFLFDVSHARLAARHIGMDEQDYIMRLPVERTAEIHFAGIQRLEGELLERLKPVLQDSHLIEYYLGREIDHVAMRPADFEAMQWVFDQIHAGQIAEPWVVSMEHGGIGGFWEVTIEENYAADLRRLYDMIHAHDERDVN